MATYVKYYIGVPGGNTISDAALAYVTILKVTRSGKTQEQISGLASGSDPKFSYEPSTGTVRFSRDIPFVDPNPAAETATTQYEKVTVIYKA